MHKILLLLAKIQIRSGLFCLRLARLKAQWEKENAEAKIRSGMAILAGTSQIIQPLSEPLPTLSQPVQPIENIKKIMTLLAYHKSITGVTGRSGSRPLAIFKNELERSVN